MYIRLSYSIFVVALFVGQVAMFGVVGRAISYIPYYLFFLLHTSDVVNEIISFSILYFLSPISLPCLVTYHSTSRKTVCTMSRLHPRRLGYH